MTEHDGLFLVREGSKGPADFVLSVLFESKVWHYKIQQAHGGGYHFYGNDFSTLTDLVSYHMLNTGKILTTLKDSPSR